MAQNPSFKVTVQPIVIANSKANISQTVHPIHSMFGSTLGFSGSADIQQESPADARVTHDSAVIPRWPSAAILDIIEPEIAPFDPPTPKTLA